MSVHTLKEQRAQYREQGKFHTPPELAAFLRGLIPGTPSEVYDPTCGSGALLAAFPDETVKFGQDIDAAALVDAGRLPGFRGHLGDLFTDPAWLDRRFAAIVANPPFSVRWEPQADERFMAVPTVPTASRADFAFLIHILHMLGDGGTAAVLCFPGVLYRGGRELTLRAWMVEQGFIEQVIAVPGGTFTDTAIPTVCLVLRKGVAVSSVRFVSLDRQVDVSASVGEIRAADYVLSVERWIPAPVVDAAPVDAWATEQAARAHAVKRLRLEVAYSAQVASFEGWPMSPFLDELRAVLDDVTAAGVS